MGREHLRQPTHCAFEERLLRYAVRSRVDEPGDLSRRLCDQGTSVTQSLCSMLRICTTALAPVPYPSTPLRHRLIAILLPHPLTHPWLLRQTPWFCPRIRCLRYWHRRPGVVARHAHPHQQTRHRLGTAHPRAVEPGRRDSCVFRGEETRRDVRCERRTERQNASTDERCKAGRIYLAG